MSNAPALAEIAALVGDPARANILLALFDGRAKTAGELTYAAGVSPQTTSGHLARLTAANLLSVVAQGRHRYFRLASPLVSEMLESIMVVASDAPPRTRPNPKLDEPLRRARTCYNHLAGRLGVGLTDALCGHGHLLLGEEAGELTPSGSAFLSDLGIDCARIPGRAILCRPCLDWSERRFHLSGWLGKALATHCFESRWVERIDNGRALAITADGSDGLKQAFDLSL
jgi:DNA-binding transcriptional ArsR family regulator